MAQSDVNEQIAAILAGLHVQLGLAAGLRQRAYGSNTGLLAKECGASPAQVMAWETGALRGTANQILNWLFQLHSHQPTPGQSFGATAVPYRERALEDLVSATAPAELAGE